MHVCRQQLLIVNFALCISGADKYIHFSASAQQHLTFEVRVYTNFDNINVFNRTSTWFYMGTSRFTDYNCISWRKQHCCQNNKRTLVNALVEMPQRHILLSIRCASTHNVVSVHMLYRWHSICEKINCNSECTITMTSLLC